MFVCVYYGIKLVFARAGVCACKRTVSECLCARVFVCVCECAFAVCVHCVHVMFVCLFFVYRTEEFRGGERCRSSDVWGEGES